MPAISTGVGVSGALALVKHSRTCPVRNSGRVRSVLNTCSRRNFSLLRALSPVTIRGIMADIEHAGRCGVTSWWSIMNLGIEIGHVVIYARIVDIDFENCDDNVTRQLCLRARDFSEELISQLGSRLLELPWDWKSTCVHLLPTWSARGPALRDTLRYFDNIEIYQYWFLISSYF